ncbi:hypothetical protein F0U44_20365 [Nocardioides humilatus]|uniref:DUF4878 domain-containing protein n=1 Tax=Nocardioides humilatus TaxID=2607660 RepID=A0A5B1L5R4_9ACTN|nr:hypothetical protein [Nocardioides humilatus]KAA1415983.1 hypothetical protein F0U44_20365 [Nocardioides humilatus]
MKPALVVAALALPLVVSACGDDQGSSADEPAPSASSTLSDDQQAVRDALVASLLDPSCDLLTDDYLVELSLFDDITPDEACDQRQKTWIEPQFGEDDILVSNIQVAGDTATAVVGSRYINITTTYRLTDVGGTWLVSCDDFTCDDLEAQSPDAPSS